MNVLTREEFKAALDTIKLSKKRRELLRYQPEMILHWADRDFLAVFDRAGSGGVLVYYDKTVVFNFVKRKANSSGRIESIICDICATWRRGTGSGVLTFRKSATNLVSYLVCADLDCSLHVRGLTEVSRVSKAQLREDIDVKAKVERLNRRLATILQEVG